MKQRLRKCWEQYIHVPLDQASKERKSRHLDRFLQVLVEVSNEESQVPHFSDMKSVSSILAGEFLADVHRICSSSQDDDVSPLGDYLLRGRGGVILKVLQTVGVQGISCAKELAELLVSILPLCFKFTSDSASGEDDNEASIQQEIQLSSMDACFSHMSDIITTITIPKFPHLSEVKPDPGVPRPCVTQSLPSSSHPSLFGEFGIPRSIRSKSQGQKLSSDSEAGEEYFGRRQKPGSAPHLLEASSDQPLGAYPGVLKDAAQAEQLLEESDVWREGEGKTPKLLLNSRELCFLLLTVTKDLCHEDCRLRVGSKKYVSMSALGSLTQLLSSLHLENVCPGKNIDERSLGEWTVGDLILIERYLLRVIVTLASYVVLQPSGVSILQVSGVLNTLVDITDNIVRAMKSLTDENEQSQSDLLTWNKFTVASETVHGLLLLFHNIFSHLPVNLSQLSSSLKLFNDIIHGHSLDLIACVLLRWEQHDSIFSDSDGDTAREATTSILSTLSRLLMVLKKAKVNYIHAVKCTKRKHRQCDYSCFLHHHHDILGIAGVSSQLLTASDSYGSMEGFNVASDPGVRQDCAVAVLGLFMLELFQRASSKLLHVRLLCTLEEGGLCCCMSPTSATSCLLQNFSSHSSGICGYILTVLTKLLLDHLGGASGIQSQPNLCAVCKDPVTDTSDWFKGQDPIVSDPEDGDNAQAARQEASDSAFSGSDLSLHEENQVMKAPRWRCMRHFQSLVLQEKEAIAVQVMQHVLRLVSQGSQALLQETFYQICLPVIQSSKPPLSADSKDNLLSAEHDDSRDDSDSNLSDCVTQYMLNCLPLLLQSRTSQNIFLNYGGVRQLCQLVREDGLRQCVLTVFQVLIVLEERRSQGFPAIALEPAELWDPEGSDQTIKADAGDEEADEMAAAATEEMQKKEKNKKKKKQGEEEDRKMQLSVLGVFLKMVFSGGVHLTKDDMMTVEEKKAALSLQFSCQMPDLALLQKHLAGGDLNRLTVICDLWNAAETLFNQSKIFRKVFVDHGGSELTFNVLSQTLDLLSETEETEEMAPGVHAKGGESSLSCWLMLLQATLSICLNSCKLQLKFGTKTVSGQEVLDQVKRSLTASAMMRQGNSGAVKTLCDTLLAVAVTAKSTMDIVQNHHFSLMHLRSQDDSMLYDKELQELSDSSSTRETETCLTEQGYEADSEFTADEATRGLKNRTRFNLDPTVANTNGRQRITRPPHNVIVHPPVCRLVLELLAAYRGQHSQGAVVPHTLLKFISLAKQNVSSMEMLYAEGVLGILLQGFKNVILSTDQHTEVEQRLVLELFLVIASHKLSSRELQIYLRLFQEENVPMEPLLKTLISLVDSLQLQPTHHLNFPVIQPFDFPSPLKSATEISSKASQDKLPTTFLDLLHPDNAKKTKQRQEILEESPPKKPGLKASGSTALLQARLQDETVWPTNQKGFSVALWMRTNGLREGEREGMREGSRGQSLKPRNMASLSAAKERPLPPRLKSALKRNHVTHHWSPNCVHVFAIGNYQLLFQLWNDPEHGNFVFRLLTHKSGKEETLCESSVSNNLLSGRWHHISVSYNETSQGDRILASVTVVVDGCLQRDVVMEYKFDLLTTSPAKECHVLLGHIATATSEADVVTSPFTSTTWQLGNLMLFKDAKLSMHTSFHLYSLGPDCCTLSHCDCSEQAAEYCHYISPELCSQLSHHANIFTSGSLSVYIQHLRENLVLAFTPKNPSSVNVYDQLFPLKPQAPGGLRGVFGSGQGAKVTAFNPVVHQPMAVQGRLTADVSAYVNKGLNSAVDEIGGISVFLFLFAKSVEQEQSEVLQAQALQLLFALIRRNARHARDFRNMDGYAMLVKVLNSSRCRLGCLTMKVLLDGATSQSLIHCSTTDQRHYLDKDTSALIRDIDAITKLLLAWRVWEAAETAVWLLAFQALELFVRNNHPHREFNIQQLQSVDIVGRMLRVCLERLQDSCPSLPIPICQSMLTVVQCVIGQPPDTQTVMTICDFLLLTHPAASTFVFHSPDSFYFRPKWMNLLKRKAARQPPRSSSFVTSTPKKILPDPTETTVDSLKQEEIPKTPHETQTGQSPLKRSLSVPNYQNLPIQTSSPQKSSEAELARQAGSRPMTYPLSSLENIALAAGDSRTTADLNELQRLRTVTQKHKTQLADDVDNRAFVPEEQCSAIRDLFPQTEKLSGLDIELIPDGGQELEKSSSLSLDLALKNSPSSHELLTSDESHKGTSPVPELESPDLEVNEAAEAVTLLRDLSTSSQGRRSSSRLSGGQRSLGSSEEQMSDWEMCSMPDSPRAEVPSVVLSHVTQDVIEEGEEGLVHISAGLLQLLCEILFQLPEEPLRKKVLGIILRPQVLLVGAHHNAAQIRICTLKVLKAFLAQSSSELRHSFLRYHGFHLLANQLHQHQSCDQIAEVCLAMMFGKMQELDQEPDIGRLSEMNSTQQLAVVPVLALLENSVHNSALCHNLLLILTRVFENSAPMIAVMLDNGLVEALCNVVRTVNASAVRLSDLGLDERGVIKEDVEHFFCIITERAFGLAGAQFYQHIEDCLTLLQLLELKQSEIFGRSSEEVCYIRHLQCHALQGVLDHVNSKLDTNDTPYFSQSSISSAVGSFLSRFPLVKSPEKEQNDAGIPLVENTSANQKPPSMTTSTSQSKLTNGKAEAQGSQQSQGMWSSFSKSLSLDPGWGTQSGITDSFAAGFLGGGRKTELSQTELLERLKKAVVMMVDCVLFTVPTRHKPEAEQRLEQLIDQEMEGQKKGRQSAIEVVSVEHGFVRSLLDFLMKAVIYSLGRSVFHRKSLTSNVLWQAKDVLRIQLCRLMMHAVSPSQPVSQRAYVTNLLANEQKCRELLKLTVHIRSTGAKLIHYLYDLLAHHHSQLTMPQREEVDEILTMMHQCGFKPIRLGTKITPEIRAGLDKERKQWDLEHNREKGAWLKRRESARYRVLHKMDSLARRVSGDAMEVTQTVVNTQNAERKKFLEHVKQQMTLRMQTKKDWQQLIQQLTHERAVWHCAKSHPKSWQLDPTEGPCRVRRRLQRCHLNILPKFLDQGYKDKLDAEKYDPPLSFLFEEDVHGSDSTAIIYKLHTNENIRHTCMCTNVTPSTETSGELLIGFNNIYFVADEAIMDANYTQTLLGNSDLLFMVLPHDDIKELHKRWYQLKDNGLEIFLTNGKTFLLAFHSTKERDQLHAHLFSLDLPNLIPGENLTAIQNLWLEGRMPNFEYLTHLNKVAGRSFNDLMQYPVLPFVLAKYGGDVLDLELPESYRNLSRPIAVQHKSRAQKFIDNYRWLENEKKRPVALEDMTTYRPDPYHYGSHYSNSGSVLHFLVRLPPFTQMFLSYQDRSFDMPDRTFHCMQTSWELASYISPTDVKELIPEFFFLPEFLTNSEGFNFGVRQTGEKVWDILLPPWCQGDPRLFTLILRQALESDYVTQHLPAWIDLVFGFKQTGKAAIDAINVFHPATYFGIEVDSITDSLRRNAIKTMIKTYGQTPKQLFKVPHPGRQLHKTTSKTTGKEKIQPLTSVKGLKWGNYVGSPDHPDLSLALTQSHTSIVSSLVALPTGEVFGLGPRCCLLVMYSKEKGITAVNTVDVVWAAIVSWGHPDNIVRIKNRKDQPQINFLHWRTDEQVTCCASVPDCRLLLFGSTSGVITVFNTKFNSSKPSHLQVFGHRQRLYGHSGPVSSVQVCKAFSVVVSASHDGTCVIWDLNRLTYVRSITEHQHAVKCVCVSETSGDIASVSHTDRGSCLMLHTINAQHVANLDCSQLLLCLAFSHSPEGRAVNVLAGGLDSGLIRLWSSWDLRPVRDISWDKLSTPVISLTFTPDGQRLFAAADNGQVMVWERPPLSRARDIVFIPFV